MWCTVEQRGDERRNFLDEHVDHQRCQDGLQKRTGITGKLVFLAGVQHEGFDKGRGRNSEKGNDTDLHRTVEHTADRFFSEEVELAHGTKGEAGNRHQGHGEELNACHEEFQRRHEEAEADNDDGDDTEQGDDGRRYHFSDAFGCTYDSRSRSIEDGFRVCTGQSGKDRCDKFDSRSVEGIYHIAGHPIPACGVNTDAFKTIHQRLHELHPMHHEKHEEAELQDNGDEVLQLVAGDKLHGQFPRSLYHGEDNEEF